jgi:beta-glucosidase
MDYDIFTEDGKRGWIGTWHSHASDESMDIVEEPIASRYIDETRIFISTSYPETITKRWTMRLKGYLKPREKDEEFEFGLIVAGRAKVGHFIFSPHFQ